MLGPAVLGNSGPRSLLLIQGLSRNATPDASSKIPISTTFLRTLSCVAFHWQRLNLVH